MNQNSRSIGEESHSLYAGDIVEGAEAAEQVAAGNAEALPDEPPVAEPEAESAPEAAPVAVEAPVAAEEAVEAPAPSATPGLTMTEAYKASQSFGPPSSK